MRIFDLTTGEFREPRPGTADGDMALAGAHGRPNLDMEIERQVKRMKAEKVAREESRIPSVRGRQEGGQGAPGGPWRGFSALRLLDSDAS